MTLFTPRIPLKEKMFFAEHLAVMLKSGIAIDRALNTLAQQTANKQIRQIYEKIYDSVQKGKPLSEGFMEFSATFGSFFINMIKAGEYAGKLEDALRSLHFQIKKDYSLKSKVISALTYPTFVVAAIMVIGSAMMVYVIPRLIPIFADFHSQLPLATRILIATSNFAAKYFLWIILSILLIGFILFKLTRGPWKKGWHTIILRLPLIGKLARNVNITRVTRTLSTLLGTGILVVDALNITAKIIGNKLFQDILIKSANEIKNGISIAATLKPYPRLFPPTVYTMIMVGEESGRLAELLEEVAQFYEEAVDETTKSISSIIEPVLIVLLGTVIGGIAIAILMPMYTLMQAV